MLYTKGERRYTEASDADILGAAAKALSRLGLGEQSIWLSGVADATLASELRQEFNLANLSRVAKETMLPEQKIEAPRRGVEPA